ncbi:hypothetical protein L541_1624 [Bordetella hinzii CA90 BAL1384]|uniref:Uncharacterized protein n=1 Tax=Bordetella hinzii OH87 BAL007II TaxID=1331262 RepID=A0ABR4QUK5_9BORD|nr:hypothetical protein L544_1265 [Bordetella hinzii OH87 BAL007II]KCB33262.1 hypothetical protein L543_1073 [Bordetella hinzii L60]KCB34332.1 hypothetical protein L541_1624 [Bordetella hinzii CA90 BAL1384]KCB43761.1 hypothetical protein L539_1518 [Bordetella hinzii 5132]KCB49881.1 hypothetical protein L538_1292 [Bordetella hinzii 4161]
MMDRNPLVLLDLACAPRARFLDHRACRQLSADAITKT